MEWDSLHEILRDLYVRMMPMCKNLTALSCGIAGLGALLYVSYRVWQSLARAEPIDILPLLRPIVIGICIAAFPTLVLGSINGILNPLVKGTHTMMQAELLNIRQLEADKEKLESESQNRDPTGAYLVRDEELDKQLQELGIGADEQDTLMTMNAECDSFGIENMVLSVLSSIFDVLFKAAALIIDVLRTYFLVVLSICGPLSFAISTFDGFQATLTQWLARYVGVYLWLPIADLFSAMLAKIQSISLQKDLELMGSDPFYMFDSSNLVYVIFLLVGIVGFFMIPTISNWIIQSGGMGAYNRRITQIGGGTTRYMAGQAKAAVAGAWKAVKESAKS